MKINITFEVNSREELVEILQTGKAHSLLDYKILDFKLNTDFTSDNKDCAVTVAEQPSPKSADADFAQS